MNPFEAQLIEVLTDMSGHLSNITKELEKISINTNDIQFLDRGDSSNDCTSDIAKNIADIGLEINHQLKGIGYCLDDGKDHGFFEKRKGGKK